MQSENRKQDRSTVVQNASLSCPHKADQDFSELLKREKNPISYCAFEVSTITVCVFPPAFQIGLNYLKNTRTSSRNRSLMRLFCALALFFQHPLFMLLVCNNVTRKTKCYKKNTVLLNSQKGLLLFLNCDKIVQQLVCPRKS